MYKKLIITNLAVILLLTAAYIAVYYFINYPMQFNLWYIIQECQLQYLPAIFAVTALASYLVSSLDFKKLNFKSKFLNVFPLLNALALAFFVYMAADGFIKNKTELRNQEDHYTKEAEKDIRKGQIVIRYTGGFSLPVDNEKTTKKVDSIAKRYGIIYKNTGCVIVKIDQKAQERYSELTHAYLDRRNGKGWEERMEKAIHDVKKN
ncbi:hypothetical protein EG346_00415 [Chryseobacterium carnipullorum]|uniref:Uncharacterized protein n=1 Tax=Chryseobacterium carnipullorum TaxID=1124835 RepID=A0A376EBJ0_CHRCU|nr:hypothetical protein [Chryseobacterium carnipullorum]AZA46771.1 hypothetical protein EG346_00415 [Chryseobacterium carnipullorum]AZA66133.1 hypothetical protein EG345_16490 [Chryseobacterium carnipullorum]STD05704.1 Uncharacterised protein [Chryseobacterium carnipullorum]